MKKHGIILLFLLFALYANAVITETGSLRGFIYGHEPAAAYDNWVTHIAEKIADPGYNLYSPWDRQTTGFGDFLIPTTTQLTNWGLVVDQFLLGNWDAAQDLLNSYAYPYQVVRFIDTDTGRTYYMLRETLNTDVDDNGTFDTYDDEIGAFENGWGLYIYNPAGTRRAIVTVPHPCDDYPTVPFGFEAFSLWNAKFILFNGASRELKWTNVGAYANSKSLSDPVRNNAHPYNVTYTKFCDKIRTEFSAKEFSIQIHSYDWNRHEGYPNVQLSAGYQKYCANLPIRDLSRFKRDIINQGDPVMLPSNTIGTHAEVGLNDYYGVFYSVHPFEYSNGDTTIVVSNAVDLPAYSENKQMQYTLSSWNDYDVYDPFFHVEMDELPNAYPQTNNNLKWFYGWDATTQKWQMEHVFDRFNQYYSRWVTDLDAVLDFTLTMNDAANPTRPTNLTVFSQSSDYVNLTWNKSDDFDFDTYEIMYATEPIGTDNFQIFDRSNDSYLASPHCEQINLTGLVTGTQYYIKIRGKDKNGNYSSASAEITVNTAPARLADFRAIGRDSRVDLTWAVQNQTNNLGCKIYRRVGTGFYQLMDSYLTNPNLMGSTGAVAKSWVDLTVTNYTTYTYRISCVNTSNVEFSYNFTADCMPRDYFKLYLSKVNGTLVDSLSFSINPYASFGSDGDFDITKSTSVTSNYVWAGFWEQYWGNNGTHLYQEVHGNYDLDTEYNTWQIRFKSDQLNQPMQVRVDDSYGRSTEKLYIRESSNGNMADLNIGPYSFNSAADQNYKTFVLYWGNLRPTVSVSALANRVYQGGSAQTFYWGSQFGFLIDHFDVSIQNATDSILVATGLANNVNSFNFSCPTNINMQNCRLVVDATAYDGEIIRKYSSYYFGIVPLSTVVAPEPGLMMQASAWPSTTVPLTNVFGAGTLGWTVDTAGEWWEITPFSFGMGYWVNKIAPFSYNSMNPIQRDSLSFMMRAGWNLLPNPHLCAYGIEDLRFRMYETVYTFGEMMDLGLLSRGVYVYRNGKYELVDSIQPHESFLLKYYGSAAMTAYITFIPYNQGPSVAPLPSSWELQLTGTQAGSDGDGLIIGVNSNSSDDYEFRYDLPEPPVKPLEALVRMYFTHTAASDSNYVDTLLNADFRSALPVDVETEKVWNFTMEAADTSPINFVVDSSRFPDGYGARISIEDYHYWIQNGDSFSYTPSAAGLLSGSIAVRNYFTGNDDNVLPALSGLRVYPNPFNPETRIAFNLGKKDAVRVDIYNIKGQHVTTLHNGILNSGKQTLTWKGMDANGKHVGSGIYFAKVTSGKKSQTTKMMLMK